MFTINGTNVVWELPSFFWVNDFVPTKDLFSSNILFDVAQYSLKISMTHSHNFFIFRRIFDRQFLHDVVEIALFIPSSSSDSLSRLTSSWLSFSSFKTSKATNTANNERTLLSTYERAILSFQNGALACVSRVDLGPELLTRPLAKFC